MKKFELLRSGDSILRVLEVRSERVLVIDCIKRTMPVWMEAVALEVYSACTIGELAEITGITPADTDCLDAEQKKIMYQRYTMIAPTVACVVATRCHGKEAYTVSGD